MITLKQAIQATPTKIRERAQNQCYGQAFTPKKKKQPPPPPEPKEEDLEEVEEEVELDEDGTPIQKPKKKVYKKKAPVEKPLKPDQLKDANGIYQEYTYQVKCTSGWHRCVLRLYGPQTPNGKMWGWCDCPYFKYHCEVALSRRGSSAVIQSNGQRPRFTNPKMEPRVCKHLYMAIILALSKKKKS